MHIIMLEKLGPTTFDVYDLPPNDVIKLITDQDLRAPKITKIDNVKVRYNNCSYKNVIRSLRDLAYHTDGKDKYFFDCEYFVKKYTIPHESCRQTYQNLYLNLYFHRLTVNRHPLQKRDSFI